MNDVFTESECVELTWRESVTIRRLRRGWTKANLAEHAGCSRTTLWRMIECNEDHERWLPVTDEIRARVEAALAAPDA